MRGHKTIENPNPPHPNPLPIGERERAESERTVDKGIKLMPRKMIDISIPLHNDIVADPPGYGPSIRYFDHKQTAEEVCKFLQELLRHLRGPVIVLLDNSSTHQGALLQKLLDQHPRLQVEHFPSYAPELNPDEGVWALAKRELANSCPDDVDELMEDIIHSINSIRTSPAKLRGLWVSHPGYFGRMVRIGRSQVE